MDKNEYSFFHKVTSKLAFKITDFFNFHRLRYLRKLWYAKNMQRCNLTNDV